MQDMFLSTLHRQDMFISALAQLEIEPFASLPFFSEAEISAMIAQTDALSFRKARETVGNNVFQDFDICFPAPLTGDFQACAKLLEDMVRHAGTHNPSLCEGRFVINDFAIQKYLAGSKGIGIHKDGLRYRNFVFIITLAGISELFCCADRQGAHPVVIDDRPGRLVILPAPGFSGLKDENNRPLHGVRAVTEGRLSIGFRQERKQ